MRKYGLRVISSFLILLLTLGLLGCHAVSSPTPKPQVSSPQLPLRVHFIDVGQGDCILAQFSNGETLLVDAGDASQGSKVVRYLRNQGVRRIDHLIATHPHADHIGGMPEVIDSFDIGRVYMPRTTHSSSTYERLLLALKKKNLSITEARAGRSVTSAGNMDVCFMAPRSTRYENLNDHSAVTRIEYGDHVFLLTGDAEAQSEREMLVSSEICPKADVLKVGHHGSGTATSAEFLRAVRPKYAVISVGAGNPYGHPAKDTLARLRKEAVQVYRTDLHGTIVFTSDGQTISVTTEKPR